MDSKKITERFLNLATCDADAILGFCRAFHLGYVQGEFSPRVRLVTHTPTPDHRDPHNKIMLQPNFRVVGMDDPDFANELTHVFTLLRNEALRFFEILQRTGMIDFSLLNIWFTEVQELRCLSLAGTIDSPIIYIPDMPLPYGDVKVELIMKIFIQPYMSKKADFWERMRQCEECGHYFFYKLDRARYCTSTCRIRANNKARKKQTQEEIM